MAFEELSGVFLGAPWATSSASKTCWLIPCYSVRQQKTVGHTSHFFYQPLYLLYFLFNVSFFCAKLSWYMCTLIRWSSKASRPPNLPSNMWEGMCPCQCPQGQRLCPGKERTDHLNTAQPEVQGSVRWLHVFPSPDCADLMPSSNFFWGCLRKQPMYSIWYAPYKRF